MLTIKRSNDKRVAKVISHMLADIPNGVNVSRSELVQPILYEGTPIGSDANGLFHVVKTAKLAANALNTDTTYTVYGNHNLKVGDLVFAAKGGKCYAITNIAANSSDPTLDDITVGTTLGVALTKDVSVLILGKTSGASAGAYKYAPIAVTGDNYNVDELTNVMVSACTIGQVLESRVDAAIGDVIKGDLKTIVFV